MGIKGKFYNFRKSTKKILNVLSWIIIVALLMVGAFLLYYVFTAKQYEKRGEEYIPPIALYTIISPSMEPKIKVYDVVLTKKVNKPEEIKVGDVITFVSTSQISSDLTVTHRVSNITEVNGEKRYKTKGDNNVKEDEAYTLYGNIMGKVIFKLPQLGRVQFLLASKGGWFIIVMLPAMGIIIYDLLKLFKLFDLKDEVITLSKKEDEDEKKDENKNEEEQLRKEELKNRIQLEENPPQVPTPDIPEFKVEENSPQVPAPDIPEFKVEEIQIPKYKDQVNNDEDDKLN
ncbi:MAG: signal peptidase I [Bacilli bacterium]|nr:signal peptidase I [Bacilli bacterium]